MKNKKNSNDYIYISVILTILLLIIGYIIYLLIGSPNIFTCKIYEKYGIYCPGCGCTRAFVSIFHGEIVESLKYNPTVLYTIIISSIYILTNTISIIRKKKNSKFVMKYKPIYLYIGITLLIVTCIIKNIYLIYTA